MYMYDTLTFQAKKNLFLNQLSSPFTGHRARGDLLSQLEMYGVAE